MARSITVGVEEVVGKSDIFYRATFLPDEQPSRLNLLLDAVFSRRCSTFFALYMELMRSAPDLCDRTGFSDASLDVIGLSSARRRDLLSDPAFLVWQGMTTSTLNATLTGLNGNQNHLRKRLLEFPEMLGRFDSRNVNPGLRLPSTKVLVQRFDIDPLIAIATPPSYSFPNTTNQRKVLERQGLPVSLFKDVAAVALERIRKTWPRVHHHFRKLVKVVGYLPDASFRSCSASRYTGVIYLTGHDLSMLEVEESLVHEAGHQLLYNIVEANALVRDDCPEDEMYTLPWSHKQRDFYGYFHAFYIYILLVKYYERVRDRPDEEQQRALDRMTFILVGLLKALPDFSGNKNFTPHGKELFRNLERVVQTLERKQRRRIGTSGATIVATSTSRAN